MYLAFEDLKVRRPRLYDRMGIVNISLVIYPIGAETIVGIATEELGHAI